MAKYKIINRTGVSIAIMASADFEINIKSNAGTTLLNEYEEPNKNQKGCSPCINSFLLTLSIKIRKEWAQIKKDYPACNILIFLSSLSRKDNEVLAKSVEEIDVIIDDKLDKPIRYIENPITSKNVALLASAWREKVDGKDDKQEYGRHAGVFLNI